MCSPQTQVLVSAGFRRAFSTICHGCLGPCCAGTWRAHTCRLAAVTTERRGLGNSLAPGGISSFPNEMGMASVGTSRISALERLCLHSTSYSLDIRARARPFIHINTAVQADCIRVLVVGGLAGTSWCAEAETPAPGFVWTVNGLELCNWTGHAGHVCNDSKAKDFTSLTDDGIRFICHTTRAHLVFYCKKISGIGSIPIETKANCV